MNINNIKLIYKVMINQFQAGLLNVQVYSSREEMGQEAAKAAAEKIRELLDEKEQINIIFAAAPSQSEFLQALRMDTRISWEKINAFHMDEYLGLDADAPQGFGNFLKERIFEGLPFRNVYYLDGNTEKPGEECRRYTELLLQNPPDIIFMGIGENGHLAFNDPPVADFKDPHQVKVVELDAVCRQQQVNDGCFESLDQVPLSALTLTLPALMDAGTIFCMVPGIKKAQAVQDTIMQDMTEAYPSTILRRHAHATLFLDKDSSSMLSKTIPVQ